MIGRQISHYRVLEKLGEGGMGVVYKAEDTRLRRTVALKFLPRAVESHATERARFLQEAQAASAFNHPNVCTVYDIGAEEDSQFIAMEYVDGVTLREKLAAGKLPTGTAVGYAIQIGEALEEAHAHGVVHRDIKAENIMVTAKGQVKVMDFGLAKLKGSLKLTKTSGTVGTLAYMAPEQIQGGEVDARSDIFSFGIVLYEMLAGCLPFRAEHEAALVYSIVNEEPVPIQAHLPEVAPELVHVLDRALEKDPEDRYQTVHDMVIDLRRLKKKTTPLASGHRPVVVAEPRREAVEGSSVAPGAHDGRWKVLPSRVKWIGAGAIVLLLCVVGWLLFPGEPHRATFTVGHTSQITSEAGVEIDPSVSPDGKMLAYVAHQNGALRVHVRQVGGGRRLCLTEGMPGHQRFPSWASDGSQLAFYSSEPSPGLYLVSALGGAPRRVMEGGFFHAVSPDGARIAYSLGADTIYMQAEDGGERIRLATVYEPHSLCWSPDGSLISLVSGNSSYHSSTAMANIAPSAIFVIAPTTGSLVQITDYASLNMSPVWADDGRSLLFVSDRDGMRDVYEVSIGESGEPEGQPHRLTTGLNAYTISLSRDSEAMVYSVLVHTANIWSIPIPERRPVPSTEAVQVTTGNQVIEGMDVSMDGRWLAYDSNRGGNQDIYKLSLKDREPVQLTTDPSDDFLPSWSPDGAMIAFYSFRTGNRDLFVMSSEGGPQTQITDDPAHERYPDWSPDGKHLVFYSDKTGSQELFIVSRSRDGTSWEEPRQLTSGGGGPPRWSPDGTLIAYAASNRLCTIVPSGGTPTILITSKNPAEIPRPEFPAWSADSRTVYYKAADDNLRSSIWAVPRAGGAARLLVTFDDPTMQSHRGEFATDGERFFFTISTYESDIWRLELARGDRPQ